MTRRTAAQERGPARPRPDSRRGRAAASRQPSRARRRLPRRAAIALAVVVIVVVGGGLAAWFTPLLGVRSVEVAGLRSLSEAEVRDRADVPDGLPLPRVDTGAAAARVATAPSVASARVQRVYPWTVRVTVTEREPLVFVESPDGSHLLDGEGVDFATVPAPPALPKLVTAQPGYGDPATTTALAVYGSLPQQLREQVVEVRAASESNVEFGLRDDRVLAWGGDEAAERKAAVALALLTQPGTTYDVSSPDLPTVK
ncbi:FtsQ-type POTRA domain-containing protein [Rhodococcus sp. HNM0569]|uniref:cell division protein FtsQ/DivIB n=1 Tax=Rhodococcus sp. HNM0569 TaxID=2716340 RepID=UPI003211F48B